MNTVNVVSCGDGWSKLYIPIIQQIVDYDKRQDSVDDKIGVVEVKEKFGCLDIKVGNYMNLISKIRRDIHRAQIRSEQVCEFCGTEERVGHTQDSWRKTCCNKCWKEHVLSINEKSHWIDDSFEYGKEQ